MIKKFTMIAFRSIKHLQGQVPPALYVSESDFDILTSSATVILPNYPTEFESKENVDLYKKICISFYIILLFNTHSD